MERVAFLIESTGVRIGCMLNPESLVVRRTSGIRPARSLGGSIVGESLADDPLLHGGGGVTELQLSLLFDVSVGGSNITSDDVRALTKPLWDMSETTQQADRNSPVVTFVWGKAWSVPGVVMALSERLEFFTAEGVPRRSWLRLRMQRVPAPPRPVPSPLPAELAPEPPSILDDAMAATSEGAPPADDEMSPHEVIGESNENPGPSAGDRVDVIAAEKYGNPAYWPLIAAFNRVADPLRIAAGTVLRLPPPHILRRGQL